MEDKKQIINELTVLQEELDRSNAENQRLRSLLSQVNNNYHVLNLHLAALMRQQQQNQNLATIEEHKMINSGLLERHKEEVVSHSSMEGGSSRSPRNEIVESMECKPSCRDNSIRSERKVDEEDGGSERGWAPNKVARFGSGSSNSREEEQAASETMSMIRKARVSVRARSEASMISDGCQWRKYGQKMAKGNPCPRAYYRCTMATGCPVRKQVQRYAEDQTILTTTYEGQHNHPLPPAAMAMASTTSAAASMILSGSLPSADGLLSSNSGFLARSSLPNCTTSFATLSASAPFPTVTLDLTRTSTDTINQQQRAILTQNDVANLSQLLPLSGSSSQVFGHQTKLLGLQGLLTNNGQLVNGQMQNPTSLADTVSSITSDPNFTTALAAAITSIIGNVKSNSNNSDKNTP
ncbi:hypothetical protein UlMin_016078 [Ulmus minor]